MDHSSRYSEASPPVMLPAVLTRAIVHGLDWAAARVLPADPRPRHQRIGAQGEEEAYFHLRKLGDVMESAISGRRVAGARPT